VRTKHNDPQKRQKLLLVYHLRFPTKLGSSLPSNPCSAAPSFPFPHRIFFHFPFKQNQHNTKPFSSTLFLSSYIYSTTIPTPTIFKFQIATNNNNNPNFSNEHRTTPLSPRIIAFFSFLHRTRSISLTGNAQWRRRQSNAFLVTRHLRFRPSHHRILLRLHPLHIQPKPCASASHARTRPARARHVPRHVILRAQTESPQSGTKRPVSMRGVSGGLRRRRIAPAAAQVRSRVPRALHRGVAGCARDLSRVPQRRERGNRGCMCAARAGGGRFCKGLWCSC